jgi:hypothetical protein
MRTPYNAYDLFDILASTYVTPTSIHDEVLQDFALMVAEEADIAENVAERLGEFAEKAENAGCISILRTIPFNVVANLGQGTESAYSDGLATLAVQGITEGYGRNRPQDGIYLELKLDAPYQARQAIERAIEDEFGIDVGLLDELCWEVDVYEEFADMIEPEFLVQANEYPYLAQAIEEGRVVRAYKGPHLTGYITFGEIVDVMKFQDSGDFDKVRDWLAIDFYAEQLRATMEYAFADIVEEMSKDDTRSFYGLDIELWVDPTEDENGRIQYKGGASSSFTDELRAIGERMDNGERFRRLSGWTLS